MKRRRISLSFWIRAKEQGNFRRHAIHNEEEAAAFCLDHEHFYFELAAGWRGKFIPRAVTHYILLVHEETMMTTTDESSTTIGLLQHDETSE